VSSTSDNSIIQKFINGYRATYIGRQSADQAASSCIPGGVGPGATACGRSTAAGKLANCDLAFECIEKLLQRLQATDVLPRELDQQDGRKDDIVQPTQQPTAS